MSGGGQALAEAASSYVGVPFRLHGRGRVEGVDCVGLLGCALAECGRRVVLPRGYGLRNLDPGKHLACFPAAGFMPLAQGSAVQPGDVLVVSPGPAQQHVLIATAGTIFVHAHAGLRKVVLSPAPLPWRVVQHWRLDDV